MNRDMRAERGGQRRGRRPLGVVALVAALAFTLLTGCDSGDDDEGAVRAPSDARTEQTEEGATGSTPAGGEPGAPAVAPGSTSGAAAAGPDNAAPGEAEPGTSTAKGESAQPAASPPAGASGTEGAPSAAAGTGSEAKPAPSGSASEFRRSREIRIFPEEAEESPFDPRLTRVFPDTLIRWVNLDVVPRSVVAKSGKFKSPMIPPGGHFDYFADEYGFFEYMDGTRPTVTGAIHVV